MKSYKHGSKRRNNPSKEMTQTSSRSKTAPKRHAVSIKEKNRNVIPTLEWMRADDGKTVPAPLLTTAEKIDPAAWLGSLRRVGAPSDMFDFDGFADPQAAKWEWYEHKGNWQNRLIHADAKRGMASLLEHENMAGEVQCVYFDPPYGMNYKGDMRLDDAVSVTAFRDTYERGIHSYLDGIRRTAQLARELLSESGSFFMQIGDVNVHRCAVVLDEVFGPENRVTTISYATTGGGSSTKSIPKACDYILQYAKNKDEMFFQQLYEYQNMEQWLKSQATYSGGDFPNGETRILTSHERENPKAIAVGTKLWRMRAITSTGRSTTGRSNPFTYDGIRFGPTGLDKRQWAVSKSGLEYLAKVNRLWTNAKDDSSSASADGLGMKIYQDEMPGRRISNIWVNQSSPSDKRYAVQTGDLVIQRCILMSTRPGDLVLDPTGGGGTTALIAETWGRRWISMDASRASIAVTRERVLVRDYPAHLLVGSDEGFAEENRLRESAGQPRLKRKPTGGSSDPATGLVVERMPKVTVATIAYEKKPDKRPRKEITWLVDRPLGKLKGRVCGRFTVESELTERYIHPDEVLSATQVRRDRNWRDRILRSLEQNGIEAQRKRRLEVEGLTPLDVDAKTPDMPTHSCHLVDRASGKSRPALLVIWPEDAKVDVAAVHRSVANAMQHATKGETLVIAAPDFADGTEPRAHLSGYAMNVERFVIPPEAHLDTKDRSLALLAEPHITIDAEGEGQHTCTIHGWREYNPVTGEATIGDKSRVALWQIDTDYDGTQFHARRLHIPNGHDKNRGTVKAILGKDADADALKATFGYKSLPFGVPKSGQIAVRIITREHHVLSCTLTVSSE